MSDLRAEIDDVFARYEAQWNSQDRGGLLAFWDADDQQPFYLAEEQDEWIVGREGLSRYFVANPGGPSFVEALLMHYRLVDVRPLGTDYAQAIGWVRHDMKLRAPRPAWGGDTRVTAVLRRTDEGWRFVSYAEAHMTPLNYMQKLYEMNVTQEFKDFHADVMAQEAAAAGDSPSPTDL
jgi:hypothetical protein